MNPRPIIAFAAALMIASPPLSVAEPSASLYDRAGILSPADGEGLRANSGDFVVQAQVEPELRQGHRLRLLLNGSAQGTAQASSTFPLTNVERGQHQLQLQIVDENGGILFEGEPTTFHLLRHSILHPRPVSP